MKYTKIKEEGYSIHIIKTNKFKKNMLKINFKSGIKKDEIMARRIIPNILVESNSLYSTRRYLNIKREELYNLVTYGNVTQSGNAIITSITSSFLNDKYAPNLLNDALEFISNLIFNPKIKDNKFDDKAFKYSLEVLKEEIDINNENPKSYALEQVYKKMSPNTSLSYSLCGTKEEVDKLNNETVLKLYKKMIDNDKIDIFIIGDLNDDTELLIKKYFGKFKGKRKNINHYVEHKDIKDNYEEYKDTKSYNQSTLIVGYKLTDLTDFERGYVLPIYSYILGGSADSKLFKNVREKHSLCYSISANIRSVSNFMFITSGIDAKSYNKVIKLIKEEVDNMAKGCFDNSDIEKAKITYISAYEEMYDSISSILNDYNTRENLKTDLVGVRKKKIIKVTKKDIMNVIPKIHPDIIYLLEGSKEA